MVASVVEPDGASAEPEYRFHTPLTGDSAVISAVRHIAQDDSGFLWFGYPRGLDRYDGVELTSVEVPGHAEITDLAVDSQGHLWIATRTHGLLIWDRGSQSILPWSPAPGSPAPPVSLSALAVDGGGRLWVGAEDGSLTTVDPLAGTTQQYEASELQGTNPGPIRSLATDARGRVWAGSTDGRLFRLEPMSGRPNALSLGVDVGSIQEIATHSGAVWAATDLGTLLRVDSDSLQVVHRIDADEVTGPDATGAILALIVDPQGRLWAGTDRGLRQWSEDAGSLLTIDFGTDISRHTTLDPVRALYLDYSGVIWIAHDQGVATTTTRASGFEHWRTEFRDATYPVTAIAADPEGAVWVGTFRGGLYRRNPDGEMSIHGRLQRDADAPEPEAGDESELWESSAMALLIDSRGDLWVGTLRRGLASWNPETESLSYLPVDPEDPKALNNSTVTALHERSSGGLWVGTFGGGLSSYEPQTSTFTGLTHDPENAKSLSENQVRAILEDSSGRLWVGTRYQGLNLRSAGSDGFEHFRNDPSDPSSISNDSVVALFEDSRGRIWAGTYEGLDRVLVDGDAVRFEHFGLEEGLHGDRILSIHEDDTGALWLSTSQGISKFDAESGSFVNLGLSHGLPPTGFNFGAHARGSDGRLHYGSNYGVTSLDPSRTLLEVYTPQIILTEVSKTGEPTDFESGSIIVSHDDGFVTFEFSLLDFGVPNQNRYERRLEGFEDEWVASGNHQRATYSRLPPGKYTFRVRGANSDGIWSANEARLEIEVLPPPWATWWAYALYVAAGLALLLGYARMQARKQQREATYTRRLEREVDIRTRELAEQNEKLRYANELLEVASVTDSLTGVRNRRFLLTTIDQDIALVDRAFTKDGADEDNSAFVFILFDLDGFKAINDNHGHSAGDLVLYQVRDLLTQACRTSDTLVRWGGDEFLIVAREATREHVETLAERIRRSVAAHDFDIGSSAPVRLTCSLGFACYPFVTSNPRLYSWEEVIDIADRALYVAKRHGPNMWAGIFGTDRTEETPSEDLLTLILERPELLNDEGSIRLVTSRPTPYEVRPAPESQHA